MKTALGALITLRALVMGQDAALAHHSFAAFFDPDKSISVSGKVTEFAFTNPHGQIAIEVRNKQGQMEQWRAETNAPVILVRRGWTRNSPRAGDEITIEGWPSRDGRHYLRMRKVTRADGAVIGTPFEPDAQK